MADFMKEPCAQCPFRADVRPFLRPARARDLAYSTTNPYNEFFCHKTISHEEDDDGFEDTVVTEKSLLCAGFLSMQVNETEREIPGFTPSELVYGEPYAMIDAYERAEEDDWYPT